MGYLDVAASQVGVRGDYNKYWAELEPSLQGAAWCACFVSWCLKHAGSLGAVGGRPFYNCTFAVNKARSMRQWYRTPKVGSLVIFDWGTGSPQHIAFVYAVYGLSSIGTIGGNESDAVKQQVRGTSQVMGYWYINAVPGSGVGVATTGSTGTGTVESTPAAPGAGGVLKPAPAQTLVGAAEGGAWVDFSRRLVA
jgi:hypothetical protein